MTNITINTSQNVNINFSLADLSKRLTAFFIDFLIKLIYFILVIILLAQSHILNGLDTWSENSIYIICYLPIAFYSLCLEYFNEGQTLGKKIIRIKVVKIDGFQASFMDYLTRWVMRLIDIQIGFGLIGFISINTSGKNQRLGDLAAGTTVISLSNTVEFGQTIFEDIDTDYIPKYPQVSLLNDNDMRIIKNNLLQARRQMDVELISQLTIKVSSIMNVTPEEDNDQFIDRVIKDYNYYTKEN